MALPFTPHTVTIQSASANKGIDKRNDSLSYSTGIVVKGMVTSSDPDATFNAWGIQTEKPSKLFINLTDATGIKLMDKVTWGARTFIVKAPVRISNHGLITDHATVLMEETT